MGDHERISYLPVPERDDVPEGVSRLWDKAQDAFGFVPNVFRAQAVNGEQFLAWWGYFNLLVNKEGHLSNADRELLAVVVSSVNRCTYCEVSHGAALREYTGDAVTADLVASNWRQAGLAERECAMASYAEKLTSTPPRSPSATSSRSAPSGSTTTRWSSSSRSSGCSTSPTGCRRALGFVPNPEYHSSGRATS